MEKHSVTLWNMVVTNNYSIKIQKKMNASRKYSYLYYSYTTLLNPEEHETTPALQLLEI